MERFTETDCSKCGVPVNVDLDPQGDLVRYDDAQRALDAERERVKELEEWQRVVVGTGTDQEAVVRMAATEYTKTAVQCWKDENAKLTAKLATLQAQLARWKEALGEWLWNCTNLLGDYHIKTVQDFNEEVNRRIAWLMQHLDHTLPPPMTDEERDRMRKLSEDNAALQADNECKDSLIETLQAQLRQAEGQSQQQAEEAVIVFAKYTTLRQLLEDVLHTFGYLRFHRVAGMDGLLYETHNKMSPERTVEACEKRIRATLAAQDAPLTDEQRDIRDCCEKPHDCKWGGLGGCGYEGRKP